MKLVTTIIGGFRYAQFILYRKTAGFGTSNGSFLNRDIPQTKNPHITGDSEPAR